MSTTIARDGVTWTTATYVRYYHPGTFISEESVREVASRDPQAAAAQAPDSAFAFAFFDRMTARAKDGDEAIDLSSKALRETGRFYINAEPLTLADVEALPGDHRALLANMQGNHWDTMLRCRTGNYQPLLDGDALVTSA